MNTIKYPNIEVNLVGSDGNSYSILAKVSRAMRNAGIEKENIDQFMQEATSSDYDNLLKTCMDWVVVN